MSITHCFFFESVESPLKTSPGVDRFAHVILQLFIV